MEFDKKVKKQLTNRGFTEEQLLNNRGLIGATINETIVALVKKSPIHDISNTVCPICNNPNYHKTPKGDCWCEDCGNEWQIGC